jgi:hypothetical protein
LNPHPAAVRLRLLLLLCLGLFVAAGCDSVTEHVRERFAAPQPQVRTYAAEPRAVFDAAVHALKGIDFEVSRARAAQGVIQAHSRIMAGDSFSDTRQYTFDIAISRDDAGQTGVSAVLKQQDESAAYAGATNLPVKQHGLYDSFFAALERELKMAGVLR